MCLRAKRRTTSDTSAVPSAISTSLVCRKRVQLVAWSHFAGSSTYVPHAGQFAAVLADVVVSSSTPSRPHCFDCYAEHFADKCNECTCAINPMPGFGGKVRLALPADDRSRCRFPTAGSTGTRPVLHARFASSPLWACRVCLALTACTASCASRAIVAPSKRPVCTFLWLNDDAIV